MKMMSLVGHFALHSLCGAALFTLVSMIAMFFNWFGHWIESYGVNKYIALPIQGLELFVFAVDFLLFVLFMLYQAMHLARAMVALEPIVLLTKSDSTD